MKRIVIIGAGLAGATAAFALREHGFEGSVVLVGEEPHLPYERPPLSKGYLRGEEPFENALVRPSVAYATQDVELLRGRRAVTLDRGARRIGLDDGRELAYDRLLLATGADARRLGVTNAFLPGVRYLRSLDDADAIRIAAVEAGRIVVIGGGWIGSEVAASLRQMGRTVTLVTNLAQPLERILGAELAAVYGGLHRANGVELVSGRVMRLDGDGRVRSVHLADGRAIPADLVVAGVGAAPRVELALRARLAISHGGVAVDERLRTSDPAIYAAGDIAAAEHPRLGIRIRVEHWDNAREQGAIAARNMLGAGEPYARTPYFFSDQFDLGMEYRGYAPMWDEVVVRGDLEHREFVAFWLREGRVLAAMNANVWDVGDELTALVAERVRVSRERLVDPDVPIRTLAA